jgi:protein-glutamine gamma-glutamyltransferase
LVVAIAFSFFLWLGWDRWRAWRYTSWLGKLPPMESLYRQMLDILASKGYKKPPSQTPLEYARRSREHHSSEGASAIDDISQAYVQWRYGGRSPNVNQLRRRLQELKKRLAIKRGRN